MSPDPTSQVTILSGASLSGPAYLGHGELVGVSIPATWTTANLTFQGSMDGSTYQNLFDDGGTEYTVTAGQATHVTIRVPVRGMLWLKVRSGTSGSAVTQGGDRIVTLLIHKLPIAALGR